MPVHKSFRLSALAAVCIGIVSLFAGCGGEMTAGIQGSGLTGGVAAVGPITGFGSIFVDGVEYSTGGAQISVDDQAATESQLRVGQIVTVKGTVNADGVTGIASTVSFASDLRGPVTQVDANAGTFVVLGQTVRVADTTLFDDSFTTQSLADISANTLVQVSGFLDSGGVLVASRVEPANANAGLQIRGAVQMLDTTAHTFRINTLTVDYSGIAPSGTLANGAFVIAQGSSLSTSGALIATRVKVVAGLGAGTNERGQLEGLVTSFTSNASFSVNGQPVTTSASTLLTPQGVVLGLDVRVKVHGTFDAAGVLVADKVEVRSQSLSLARGLVDAVSASGHTLRVLGVNVTTDAATSFEDKSSLHVRLFGLADVRTGDYIEVRGTADASGTLSAATIERQRPDNRVYLQGVARNVSAPTFSVLGVTVTTDAQTQYPGSGGPDHATQFFANAANQIVRVRGMLVGDTLVADQAQIRQQ
jgi:hypothetical protein